MHGDLCRSVDPIIRSVRCRPVELASGVGKNAPRRRSRGTVALYKAQVLEPINPALILPEVLDPSKWYEGEHPYIDPDKRYIFVFVANSLSGQVTYIFNDWSGQWASNPRRPVWEFCYKMKVFL